MTTTTAGRWGGRKVRRLTALVLTLKGTTCHLCGLGGANSCDHDPPRSELIAAGVLDPDALVYLFPSHLRPCNLARRTRPVTEALRLELQAKRLAMLGHHALTDGLSPRFARRRPSFEDARPGGSQSLPRYLSGSAEKNSSKPEIDWTEAER